jgi:uncharacterized protein YbcI
MTGELPSEAEVQSAIANELIKVHENSYGTGASNIDVYLSGDTVLAVIDIELTPAERTLISAGQDEAVKVSREAYQAAIAPTFGAIVERATGRAVESFLSAVSIQPLYTVEFFRLRPG